MIPESFVFDEEENVEGNESLPDKTYRLDFVNKRIIGTVQGKDAVMQFIKKVLNTDKYANIIYNWYYGNEINTLVGMPYDYVVTELPRIIEEALLVDDRVKEIVDFELTKLSADSCSVSFVVRTIYGDINYSQEVMV